MALLGVSGIIVFVGSFLLLYVHASLDDDPGNNPAGGMQMFPKQWFSAAAAVPNILLSFGFQLNFFPIFKGMRAASDHRMTRAAASGMAFCAFAYLLVGILGYDYVGDHVQPNFLESLDYHRVPSPYFFLINISFLLSIFFAFPIIFFSCRNNFIALVKLALAKPAGRQESGEAGGQWRWTEEAGSE